jgi:hypothetical protein
MLKAGFVFLLLVSPALGQTADPTPHELLTIINERDKAYNQRFDAQEKAVAAALAAAKEAVAKAETAAEKRFDAVNEFRSTLKDQQATLMPRSEVVTLLHALDEKVQNNDVRINQVISRSEGVNWLWGMIVGVCGISGVIVGAVGVFMGLRRRAGP